jgi:hypothetical protein
METAVSRDMLKSIYNDMHVRIEMGLASFDDAESFMEHLWDAIAERLPEEYHPEKPKHVDMFSTMFGTVSERLIREHYSEEGGEWW